MNEARQLWVGFETVHAVTYFAPRCVEANRDLGLRGFWMGYFATRSAPLGTPSAAEVADAFFGFRPSMVERAIPDAWSFADSAAVLDTRVVVAAEVLRSVSDEVEESALSIIQSLEAVASDPHIDGPLAGPNRDLATRHDPVERLWQACTTLREHRGDIHVSALRGARLGPRETLVLVAASGGAPRERFQAVRGWTDEEWDEAARSLIERDLLDREGMVTRAGERIRADVEETTDRRAIEPWAAVTQAERDRASAVLVALASNIADAGILTYPNPIGLPRP